MKHILAPCAVIALILGSLALTPAGADVIHLKKGGKLKGVIIGESEDSIEIRSKLGTITLSRGAIAEIEKSSEEENRALKGKWLKERQEKEEKVARTKQFENEQMARGLVKYKGSWMPAEKMYEMEKGTKEDMEKRSREFDDQKRSLEEMENRLKEMEARLERRESELNFREQQLSIREQNLLLQQRNLQNQAERIARDKEDRPPKIFAVPRIEVVPPSGK